MSEQDESPVSRRQFFRGMTGGFFRAIGDLSGIDRLLEEQEPEPEIVNLTEDDVLVPPEKQAKALAEIFGFLEQHEPQPEADEVGEPEPASAVGDPDEPDSEAGEPEPDATTEGHAEPAHDGPDRPEGVEPDAPQGG